MIVAKKMPGISAVQTIARSAERADATTRIGRASVSIIVPVLNEVELIGPFLQQLRERAPGAEVIVADGGSTDGTREAAETLCDQILTSGPGRARQLN